MPCHGAVGREEDQLEGFEFYQVTQGKSLWRAQVPLYSGSMASVPVSIQFQVAYDMRRSALLIKGSERMRELKEGEATGQAVRGLIRSLGYKVECKKGFFLGILRRNRSLC